MPSQELALTLSYDGADNAATVWSQRNPATARWGVKDEGSAIGAALCTAQLDNTSGNYDPADARSTLYGKIGRNTPATVTVGPEVLADGAVSSWSPDRGIPDTDRWTDIEITGPAQRVNASKAVMSALRRTILAANPLAYWALEDPAGTTVPSPAVPGTPTPRMEGSGEFGDTSVAGGAASLADLMSNGATLVFPLANLGLSSTELHVELAYGAAPGVATDFIMAIGTSSFPLTWNQIATGASGDGELHLLSFNAVLNGANVDYTVYRDDAIQSFSIPGDIGQPQDVRIGVVPSGAVTPEHWMLGHLAVYSTFTDPTDRIAAANGFLGEGAEDRFERLCAEHGIPSNVYSTGTDQHTMGRQLPDTLPNLLTEVARTDGGLVYDARAYNELEYRPHRSMWNQVPALTLTMDDNVAPPIRPASDTLGIANDVTATPREGVAFRVSRDSGPLNTSDPADDPEGVGRQEDEIQANPETLERLRDIAGWALHVGTWPGARYRSVTVDLDTNSDLVPDVMSLRPGDVLSIDGLDADQVELMVLGAVDTVESHARRITFNCAPAGPWRVPAVGLTGYKRIGHANSWLAANYTAGATSLSVASSGALWSTTASAFRIRLAGMVLDVTAVAGAASPQTFTVSATPANGVSRDVTAVGSATALTRIDIDQPVYVGH